MRINRLFDKSNVRFFLALTLSLFGHALFLVYLFSSVFPAFQQASATTIRPKFLNVQLTQTNPATQINHVTLQSNENAPVTTDDVSVKTEIKKPEAFPDAPSSPPVEEVSGSELSSILNIKYYSLSELDQIPATRNTVDMASLDLLDYPQAGKLTLRLWVDEYGKVTSVEVISSELPPDFADHASKLFQQAEFFPGTVKNHPVRFMSKVVVHYVPLNSRSK
jgi:TonB family protein